ncbi:DUF4190 domain-containing protein [Micromonospora chalcea]|uniref:DUF4190 domain-containing protein n=1 Tax=Micromonospora chalcea TaxID=1874 RepID=UPI00157C0BB3|nr:DUF4190 domain-containing protein [Micromonospora chalcea]
MKILSRRNSPATSSDTNGDGVVDERDRTAEQPADRPVVTDRDEERTTYRSAATATDAERARDAATDRDARDLGATTDGRTATTTTDGRTVTADDEREAEARRRAADRGAAARAVTGRRTDADTRTVPVTDARTVGAAPATERTTDLDRDGRPDRTDLDRDGRTDLDRDGRPDGTDTDGDGRVDRPEPYTTKRPRASLLATLGLIVSVVGALFVLSGTLAGYGIGVGAAGAVLAVLGLIATRRRHVAGKTDALIGIAVGLAAVVLGIVAMTGQFDWPTTDGDWVGRFREWLDSQFGNWF